MEPYEKLLSELRYRYEIKYHKKLDDDLLYLIIRMNEMEARLKHEIQLSRKPLLKSKADLFVYGLGRNLIPGLVTVLALVVCVLLILK